MRYYVSLAGDDNNSGTYENPWLTPGQVGTYAASPGFVAGDTIAFRGGDLFTGGTSQFVISLNNVIGTSTAPITVASYGTGTATIETTLNTLNPLSLSGTTTYIVVEDLNFLAPEGTGGTSRCINLNGVDNNTIRRVTTNGGDYGVFALGDGTVLSHITSSFAWDTNIYVSGAGVTYGNLKSIGAGYETGYATQNATSGEGIGLDIVAGDTVGDVATLLGCKHALNVTAGSELTANALYLNVDRLDQDTAIIADGDECRLINMIAIYSAEVATTGGAGTYQMIDVSDTADIISSTVMSTLGTTGDAGAVLIRVQAGATLTTKNMLLTSEAVTLIERIATATYAGSFNALSTSASTETLNNGGAITVDAWNTANETATTVEQVPDYEFITTSVANPILQVLDSRSVILTDDNALHLLGSSTVKSAYFDPYGFDATDHYGGLRPPTVIDSWTIGAHEPTVATYQEIDVTGAGGPVWQIASPSNLPTYAALLQVPSTAKGYSFYVESELFMDDLFSIVADNAKIGIWALGSRLVSGPTATSVTTRDVWVEPALTSSLLSDSADKWQLGSTATQDLRRVICYIDGEANSIHLVSQHDDLLLNESATVPVTLRNIAEIPLRMELNYRGRRPGGVNGSYVYDITCLMNGRPLISKRGIAVPASWIEGTNSAIGRADYAGVYGVDGQEGANAIGWESFTGTITSALSSVLPAGVKGQALEKDYFASRREATNLLINGGFTGYPRKMDIVKLPNVVASADPFTVPPSAGVVGVHLGFVLDASNSIGGYIPRMKRILDKCISLLPIDGSIMVTIIKNWATSNVVVGTAVLDASSRTTMLAAIAGLGATRNGESWAIAWADMHTAMSTGVTIAGLQETGYSKMIVNITEHATATTASTTQAVLDATADMHALPGLREIDLILIEAQIQQVYNVGVWPNVLFPQNIPVNDPAVVGQPWESTLQMPNTNGPIAVSVKGDAAPGGTILPSTPNQTGNAADIAIGGDFYLQVLKWRTDWQNQIVTSSNTAPDLNYRDAFQALPQRNPGYSINVPSTRPVESDLGAWVTWGSSSILEVVSPSVAPSPDGGNTVRLILGATGEVNLAQKITDLRPLAGQTISLAFSASAGQGRVKVSPVATINGTETVLGTFYSRSFGFSSRVVRTVELPSGLSSLEVGLKFEGPVDTSLQFSALQLSLGNYRPQLPFSESPLDSVIPRGTILMVNGTTCPSGYRELPDSEGRIPYGFLGDPNFYERDLGPAPDSGPQPGDPVYDSDLDIGILIDGSSDQRSYGPAVHAMLTKLILTQLPEDGTVRVVVMFTSKPHDSLVLIPLTPVTPANKAGSLKLAIDKLVDSTQTPNFGGNDRYFNGMNALRVILNATGGRQKMVLATNNVAQATDSREINAQTDLAAIDRFVEYSTVVFANSMTNPPIGSVGTRCWPAPRTQAPGIVFLWSGGQPGTAVNNQFANQIIPAGNYIADVFFRSVDLWLPTPSQPNPVNVQTVDDAVANNLGGQLEHDHADGTAFGSSIDESDGFEPAGAGNTVTPSQLPPRDSGAIGVYPFGVEPSSTRSEDPPALAIGTTHTHAFNSRQSAQVPGFGLKMCEKL